MTLPWLREVPETVVGDLVAGKRTLIDIDCSSSIAQTLECLRIHNILSVPVFGKKGGWIGSGGVEVIVGEKQYIGIASVVDILSYMFGNPSRTVEEALSKPISQVLGSTDESLCLWVEPTDRPLLYVCEALGKGVHRVLVTDEGSQTCRLLSQTDVIKFLVTHSTALPHLREVFSRPVSTISAVHDPLVCVNINDSIKDGIESMLRHRVSGVPVVNDAGVLVSQLSTSDFRSVFNLALGALADISVRDFMLSTRSGFVIDPIVCDDATTIGEAVQKMLLNHVHRIWIRQSSNSKALSVVTFTDIIAAAFSAAEE